MVGADVDLSPWTALPRRALLFGEGQGRVIVSTDDPDALIRLAGVRGVPAHRIGTTRPGSADLRVTVAGDCIVAPLAQLAAAYHDAIPSAMHREA
jgi:phosphoribosylformylglycinamidine synthase